MVLEKNKNKLISIIQARMSSQRLPGKVLLKLGKSNVLGQVIRRAKSFSDKVVVCTSLDKSDDRIFKYCLLHDIDCYRGSLNDVFSRFKDILSKKENQSFNWFARLTADNPLISIKLANHLKNFAFLNNEYDYLAFSSDQIVIGTGIEIIKKETFLNINNLLLDKEEKEHVTLALYEKDNNYKSKFIVSPFKNPCENIRLTLDYPMDYKLLNLLFNISDNMSSEEAIKIIQSNPDIKKINKNCNQKKVR